nr:translational initiation factor 1 [[Bauhinia] glauca var. hupehana]WPN87544.1 translational initiation factor 1 [[Bauhinia] glauca var. hupehana]
MFRVRLDNEDMILVYASERI